MGQTYSFSELQGLTREQVERGGPVKFSLVREAGTVTCEGVSKRKRRRDVSFCRESQFHIGNEEPRL